MRADTHDGPEQRSNQRPDTLMQDRIARVEETSCTARPDHTLGSKASDRRAGRVRGMSAVPLIATELCPAAVRRLVPIGDLSRCSKRSYSPPSSSALAV